MSALNALAAGFAGASALTLLHETARRFVPDAPRMDVLGMRAIDRGVRSLGAEPPTGEPLRAAALAGDLASNTLYYALVGAADLDRAPACGAALGLLAGLGAVALPGPLGLGAAPSNRTTATQVMTVAWYTLGGLAAGVAYQRFGRWPGVTSSPASPAAGRSRARGRPAGCRGGSP